MPVYCFNCASCGPVELVRPMAEASDPATCDCGRALQRDYRAQQTRGFAVPQYQAASGGAFPHEMKRAYRRGKNWFARSAETGKERQLNPPGFDLDRKTGNVIVPGSNGARRKYLDTMGYVERS